MPSPIPTFPENFVWGVATAAPQIEGAAFLDGKGESIWDRFSRIPGKVRNGDTLDQACDHYHRFGEDLALMRALGIRNYRLSIAWPRIYPAGDGPVNAAGLAFYHRLFDSMAEHGITHWVTLFHWDLPQALEDRGGWPSRVVVDAFARYADTVVQAFAGKVKRWFTVNEVRCFTDFGYGPGGHNRAPGRVESARVVNQTFHHALLCHGHAVRAVRAHGGAGARVGIADNCDACVPVTETPADIEAASAWFVDGNQNVIDPIYRGHYADAYLRRIGRDAPEVAPGDFDLIGAPTDFLGLNLYSGSFVRACAGARYEVLPTPPNYWHADGNWLKLMPQLMYWATRFSKEHYGPREIYITENGCGYDDEPVVNGEVTDLHRREFLRLYLGELRRAIGEGVPVRGYFVWSFLDNFEWNDGYTRRFGIVHVDFATQKRTPKLSARYFSEIIRQNGLL